MRAFVPPLRMLQSPCSASALRLLHLFGRPSAFNCERWPAGALPGAADHGGSCGDRFGEPLFENRTHAKEKLLEVVAVVGVLAGRRFGVGLQDAIDQLIAGEQGVEGGVPRVQDW